MAKKPSVFICSGCGIGEALDVGRLRALAEGELGAAAVAVHPHLCGPEGVGLIAGHRTPGTGEETPIVIAACSPRVNAEVFRWDGAAMERVNLRELVAWSQPAGEEATQLLAEDYLRIGAVRAEKTDPLKPDAGPVAERVLVVGGGAAGLNAALGAAASGQDVVLVERREQLGGWLARWHRLTPRSHPYRDPEETGIGDLVRHVQEHPRIEVLTGAEVDSTAGQPGGFTVTVRQGGGTRPIEVGAVVLATGWRPYDANKLGHLGFGRCTNVVTSVTFEEMAAAGAIARPSDGRAPRRVAFLQCAGSRDPDHLPYCSAFCCNVSLKQALYVREHHPEAQAFIFYRDMRTPGTGELFYRRVQEDEGVFLARGDVTGVREDADGNVVIEVEDSLLGERVSLAVDLAVLAVGAVPATADAPILNLQYRQGPAVPTDRHGFPDSNFICFPYETRRTGVYAAGCVRQPMGAGDSADDGDGAALKAIQSIRMAARGAAVHPRSGDLSLPRFFLQSCTQCKRCTEECPFGALDDDERGTPKLNPSRCRRCGTCMGACPQRIISFANYSVDQLSAATKAMPVPDDPDQPRVLAFVCENDAYPAFDMAGINRLRLDPNVRIVPVRCLGSVNVVLIADAFSRGVDGVLLIGCKSGDDYQCHFVRGSELAERRMANVQETLDRLMIERERVRLVHLAISDFDRLPALTGDFVAEMKRLGPSPYKGF